MWELLFRELLPVWPMTVLVPWVLPASCTPHSGANELRLLMALALAPRLLDSSMQDKGTGLEEKLLSGRGASNFYNMPHLQYTEILKNDVCIEFLKVDSFYVYQRSLLFREELL